MSRQMLWNGNKAVPGQGVTQTWGFLYPEGTTQAATECITSCYAVAPRRLWPLEGCGIFWVRSWVGTAGCGDSMRSNLWAHPQVIFRLDSRADAFRRLSSGRIRDSVGVYSKFMDHCLGLQQQLASLFYTKTWLEFDLVNFWPLWWSKWEYVDGETKVSTWTSF